VTTPELAADVLAGLDTALSLAHLLRGRDGTGRELDAQGVKLPSAA